MENTSPATRPIVKFFDHLLYYCQRNTPVRQSRVSWRLLLHSLVARLPSDKRTVYCLTVPSLTVKSNANWR